MPAALACVELLPGMIVRARALFRQRTDGMTADSFDFDHAFLARVATRIVNEVKGINRVVYDVTSKPPGTIEWE